MFNPCGFPNRKNKGDELYIYYVYRCQSKEKKSLIFLLTPLIIILCIYLEKAHA